ncbi:disease resistance protein Pik-2 isoform X2 [Triticum aestivum]|uniref:disease resistance protein Pik-2 isoform X2 n=1 Tax=Triticum aestivum TaxID=4565 RepID=UPI001D019746|nr:disease resistance protein Pik-2-like isoform X2 [Triticum aestivum]
MEATAVSVGKAVLDGALGYAKSKAAEEIALQLGVERDVDFIKDELQMMQSFLMTADEEQSQNKVLTTWVKQIGVLAYKVEDSLMDFGLHSEKKPFLGCIPRNPGDRRRIAKEVKELRAKVEDVSNRNLRYRLINESSGSKPTAAREQASIATSAMFGINETRLENSSEVGLHQLITSNDVDLRVIALWGTCSDLGKTTAIQEVYDDHEVLQRFGFRAWIRLMHPFNPQEFLKSLLKQFYENSHDEVGEAEQETSVGANVLAMMRKMDQSDLIREFNVQLCSNSYLIVIDDLSTIVQWHCIKKYFPDNKKQSRIIVSAQQVEIARLCIEKPCQVSEFKQLTCDQTIYLFHKKNSEEQVVLGRIARKMFDRSRTLALADEVLCGRETDKSFVIRLVGQPYSNRGSNVISVWGKGYLGKTTLVRSVYRSQELGGWKRAWVTVSHPFNPEALLRDLALQLRNAIPEDRAGSTATGEQKKIISEMKLQELEEELARVLIRQRCLVVVDDIWFTSEWDLVKQGLHNAGKIIVTTREGYIAKHCSRDDKNIYCLQGLMADGALDLFIEKVFKNNTEKNYLTPAMMEQAKITVQKCHGHTLAILTIGGFLATRPKTAIEWRKMNDCISTEFDTDPELTTIKTILMRSYDGLPYHLKSPFLYLSIFPKDWRMRWGRLVRRWIAEGYSKDMRSMTAVEVCQMYFDELLDRGMILPWEGTNHYHEKISSWQLHDMIRAICIPKAREDNLVSTLEEGCCLSDPQDAIRHLVIRRSWKRDKDVLESKLDLSHVRSLTVFGEWRSFFISDNMRFLRVLDLEDAIGLRDHHLDQIGKHRHLKYLSLRGCHDILSLPNSLGNLRHLETLDVRGTLIHELPTTITNFLELQCLHADDLFLRPQVLDACLNRYDLFSLHCFSKECSENVILPRGIGRLKALDTLGFVNVSGRNGSSTIKQFGYLTQLRKLRVAGISGEDSNELWSAISGHSQLRSLSVKGNELDGCFGEGLLRPASFQSLHKLQNLSKLKLEHTLLKQDDDAIQALGCLPNLVVLHLMIDSFTGTMPQLKLLQVGLCSELKDISCLPSLTNLDEIRFTSLNGSVKEEVQRQVAEHMRHVRLNIVD